MGAVSEDIVTGTDFAVVNVSDFDRGCEFYGDVLGLPRSATYGRMPGAEFETGNLTLAVMQLDAFGEHLKFAPNPNPIALRVDDVDAARAQLESKGVEFSGQIDSGVCIQAFFQDPDGNGLILHHRYAPRT